MHGDSQRKHVLLVDDDVDLLPLLVAYLDRHARVTTAGSASDAMAALAEGKYDAVISDLNLEEEDEGLWVLAEAQRLQPGIRCVLMTGADPPDLPGTLVLAKPFGPETLEGLLE